MNFICTVFEQGDEMLTLLSMEKTMVECNHISTPFKGIPQERNVTAFIVHALNCF